MIEKDSEVECGMLFIDVQKLINTWKIMIKTKIKYWDINNLYGYAVLQKLPVAGLKVLEISIYWRFHKKTIMDTDNGQWIFSMLSVAMFLC